GFGLAALAVVAGYIGYATYNLDAELAAHAAPIPLPGVGWKRPDKPSSARFPRCKPPMLPTSPGLRPNSATPPPIRRSTTGGLIRGKIDIITEDTRGWKG